MADRLAASDVVVLPLKTGVGDKNGSYWAARRQGVPIVATHSTKQGLEAESNVIWCEPNNIHEMSEALNACLKLRTRGRNIARSHGQT